MEDSDDNLSFVSASESDFDIEPGLPLPSFRSSEFLRQGSPASLTSVCSFRRRKDKRPAPQPPVKIPEDISSQSLGVATESECNNSSASMTSFVQQFHKGVEKDTNENSTEQCKIVEGLVSHPINFVSMKPSQTLPTQHGQDEIREEGPTEIFCKLQLRMIDDIVEPSSTNFPSSSGILSTPSLHNIQTQAVMSSFPLDTSIYSSPIYSSFIPQHRPSTDGAFYVASVNGHTSVSGLSTFPIASPPLVASSVTGSAQYVPVAPLAYIPQMHHQSVGPLTSHLPTSPGFGGPYITQRHFNPLAHSLSDPGIHNMVTNILPVQQPPAPSLEPLTEEEDDSYEDVFVEDASVKKDIVPLHGKRGRRLERSDSITVAHLYEDIIISSRWNVKVTFTNLTMVVIGMALFLPNSAAILYNFFRLVFGTLFPAYYSYKAVKTKNVKEYVKWMMYWIVFAFFTCAETITDVFLSFWFPFYYEIKILVVLWLLSPATRGSSILYRKFVHPWLTKKEEEIDDCIAKAKQQGYTTVVQLGTKGVNYATSVIMQTAIKGGGGLVSQLKRSYSTSEIGEDTADHNSNVKALPHKEIHQNPSEEDDMSISSGSIESEPRHRSESESFSTRTRGHSTGRATRTSKARSADVSDVYFHEVPEPVVQRRSPRTHDAGRTAEGGGHTANPTRRSRSGDISYATLPRTATKRASTVKKRQA